MFGGGETYSFDSATCVLSLTFVWKTDCVFDGQLRVTFQIYLLAYFWSPVLAFEETSLIFVPLRIHGIVQQNFYQWPVPELMLLYVPRFTRCKCLSRKSCFIGSRILYFISALGMVSFFLSLRCISGVESTIKITFTRTLEEFEMMCYAIQERESETAGAGERRHVDIPSDGYVHICTVRKCVSPLITQHIHARGTRTVGQARSGASAFQLVMKVKG